MLKRIMNKDIKLIGRELKSNNSGILCLANPVFDMVRASFLPTYNYLANHEKTNNKTTSF